jgi:hypothetical protein
MPVAHSFIPCVHCVYTLFGVFVIKFDAEKQKLPAGYKIPVKQIIVLDVFDHTTNATFWTHNPNTWIGMFKQTAEETDKEPV